MSRDSDLICTLCALPINRCACKRKEEHIREASLGNKVAARWCRKCNNHYAFCNCKEPDWCMKVYGKLEPLPDSICDQMGIPRQGSKWKTLADQLNERERKHGSN